MSHIKGFYLTLDIENKYNDLDEEKILNEVLNVNTGSLESVISNIINQAVLSHMNLTIDSTIMQMLVLNDYLISSFIKNFDKIMYNYIIYYLEMHQVKQIEEKELDKIKKIMDSIDMKTELETLTDSINKQWHLIK